jgi:hypothetical protein
MFADFYPCKSAMIRVYLPNSIDVIFKNKISSPPIKSPTRSDITITAVVSFIVSALVGQVTFLSSDTTSPKNLAGATFGILGVAGRSMIVFYHVLLMFHNHVLILSFNKKPPPRGHSL